MKEAIRVGLNGIYIEPVIVPVSQSGVTAIYSTPELLEEGVEPLEPEVIGYIIAEPTPQGLYLLRWDLEAWDEYHEALTASRELYTELYADWASLSEDERGDAPVYVAPSQPEFWVEGLTQEEIDDIRNAPQPENDNQKIESLQNENAFIALELMNTQIRLDQTEQSQADLLLLLVGEGVL